MSGGGLSGSSLGAHRLKHPTSIQLDHLLLAPSVTMSRPYLPEKKKMSRFRRLDTAHISAIESLARRYPFLKDRMEVHMPYHRAKPAFQQGSLWVWPKFDKRPVGFLIFMEDHPPCIWYPDRQEGMILRWMLPPLFCEKGPLVFLANLLPSESVLQVEDLLIHHGKPVWSTLPFSARWETLQSTWKEIPLDQPLLAVTPRLVAPICLADWPLHYDFAIYWIIQPDHSGQPRWFWKDVVTPHAAPTYVAPQLKRNPEVMTMLCAQCTPCMKSMLPDIYELTSQEGESLGYASVTTLALSQGLRKVCTEESKAVPVEVRWNDTFQKYQVLRVLPEGTPVSTSSFFHHR